MHSCAMNVGPSTLHSTRFVAMLGQMMSRLFGRLVEPYAVKPHLPIPLFLGQKSV